MSVNLILTLIGNDRPGLVEQLATTISQHGGNWLESSFSRLAGKFAGVLRVEAPAEHAEALQQALEQLSEFRITLERADASSPDSYPHRLNLSLTSHDRIGIVRDLSVLLSRLGVNVESLATEVRSAPMSGELLFEAQAKLQVQQPSTINELKRALEQLSDELMVEISPDEPL